MNIISKNENGFSAIEAMLIVIIIGMIGFVGWYVLNAQKNTDKDLSVTNTTAVAPKKSATKQTNKGTDPSENGKYFVIKEWGARVALPQELQGKVSYVINDAEDPDSGLTLEVAKIYLTSTSLISNDCAVTSTSLGPSVDSGAQYIRSNNAKPFNAARYKPTFKEDILTDGTYSYHLNFATPDCVGTGANNTLVEQLQATLTDLAKYN